MTVRGSDNITWDAENRPVNVSYNGTSSTFVYDGDGMRVRKTENGETILYVNKYYEKNLTTGEETSYYYLGNRLVAKHSNTKLNYIHQDHLTGTALVTSDNGTQLGSTKYYPFGDRLESQGDLGTDKLFTGQRLDDTGLYYYNARYYDANIGRFISADTITQTGVLPTGQLIKDLTVSYSDVAVMQKIRFAYPTTYVLVNSPVNPQGLNRYSYCLNNPLKYIDSQGNFVIVIAGAVIGIEYVLVAVGILSVAALEPQTHWIQNTNKEIVKGLTTLGKNIRDSVSTVLSKSDDSRIGSVKALVRKIIEHEAKINSSPPNDPFRNKRGPDEIKNYIKEIIEELKKMGPNARKQAIEYLQDNEPQVVEEFAKLYPKLMPK
ncbi:MAG: RHS repeat-associated core domain-containing protein [Dehalococcoidales bacterium]|jgi:RHS repeat-associated protein